MSKEVQTALDTCGICRVNNARQEHVPIGEMLIATCTCQIGLMFESSLHAAKYICVVIDHYLGWVEACVLNKRK